MNSHPTPGKIIVINGPSSSGKTTLAMAAQNQFDLPFIRFSFDLFLDSQALPRHKIKSGAFSWEHMRPSVFDGIHRCVPALANAGNNILFDHIIETKDWLADLLRLFSGLDVFFIGLHCSLPELERREIQRGNRNPGEAQTDLLTVHKITSYDLELNSENTPEDNARTLIAAWEKRQHPNAMDRMIKEMMING